MKLIKVKVNRFMSLQNIEFDFPAGVILVEGYNEETGGSNGAGKSSLFEAVFYALYGKTLRGSTDNKANVELEFMDNEGNVWFIHRTKMKLSLFKNGKAITDLKTNLQKRIEQIIGVSWRTFQTIIYFTPYTITKWFVEFSDTDRKNMFSEILNLQWLDALLNNVKNKRKELESQFLQKQNEFNTSRAIISELEEALKPAEGIKLAINKKIEALKEMGFDFNQSSLQAFKESIEEVINKMSQELSQLEFKRRELSGKINENMSQISRIKVLTVCPTCKQKVSDEHKSKIEMDLKMSNDNMNKELMNLSAKITELQSEVTRWTGILNIFKEIEILQAQLNNFSGQYKRLEKYKNLLPKQFKELEKLEKEVEEMKIWEKIFSPTGVKSIVLENIINFVSQYMKVYSYIMGLEVETVIDNKGKINYSVDYKSLSSGERRRVEVALLFALRQVIPVPFDLLVIDEIFDHLDYVGLESVSPIIEEFSMANNLPVFVVSHRPDLPIPYTEKWRIVKTKEGISNVLERQ